MAASLRTALALAAALCIPALGASAQEAAPASASGTALDRAAAAGARTCMHAWRHADRAEMRAEMRQHARSVRAAGPGGARAAERHAFAERMREGDRARADAARLRCGAPGR